MAPRTAELIGRFLLLMRIAPTQHQGRRQGVRGSEEILEQLLAGTGSARSKAVRVTKGRRGARGGAMDLGGSGEQGRTSDTMRRARMLGRQRSLWLELSVGQPLRGTAWLGPGNNRRAPTEAPGITQGVAVSLMLVFLQPEQVLLQQRKRLSGKASAGAARSRSTFSMGACIRTGEVMRLAAGSWGIISHAWPTPRAVHRMKMHRMQVLMVRVTLARPRCLRFRKWTRSRRKQTVGCNRQGTRQGTRTDRADQPKTHFPGLGRRRMHRRR